MARTRAVVVVGLTLAGCGAKDPQPTANPPPPEPVEAPEPVIEPPRNPPAPSLPTWDEVKSGHPEGATNPPRPELIVTPAGVCHKKWVSGMLAPQPGQPFGDRVEDCTENCGTEIQCPPKANELLKAYEAETKPEAETPDHAEPPAE